MRTNFPRIQTLLCQNGSKPESRNLDWISAVLVWALVMTVTRRLLVTNWTDELYLITYIVNLSFLFGLALGYSRFRSQTILIFAIVYGLFFIGWRLGLLLSPTLSWIEKMSSLFIRLSITSQRIAINQPVYDNLLFLLLMMVLFWIIGLNSSYSFVRSKNSLRLIIPLFVAIILIHTYDQLNPSRNGYLYFFSFLAILVIGRLFYIKQKEVWHQRQFYLPPQLSTEALQFTITLVIPLLILSFILPSSRSQLDAMVRVWEIIKEPFKSIQEGFENAFSSLHVTTNIQPEFYERTLNLGRGNKLSENEIFTAIAQGKLPEGTRIFWRSRAYDRYENGQWSLSEFSTQDFGENALEIEYSAFPNRTYRMQSFTIYLNQQLTTLIFPAQPEWTNLAVQIEYNENPDSTQDLFAIRSQTPLSAGKFYNARASLTTATVEQLRKAGDVYPSWVTDRYLQLPDTLTERTQALATEIAKDSDTPYDKTVAVTEYLRTHITYIETLEELPMNQELIDWFLFDYKQGFCNYYATAEVLMLRSLGIPARLAVGFSEGTLEDIQTANVFIIRQRDAHAWPEVFFPNIGWVEFEPTSSQPALIRPQKIEKDHPQTESTIQEINPQEILKKLREEKEEDQILPPTDQRGSPIYTVIILVLLILSLLSWITLNHQKALQIYQQLPDVLENRIRTLGLPPPKIITDWNQLTKLSPIERSYQRINIALRILRNPAPIHYTPLERAHKLLKLLPEAEFEINQLIQQYHASLYGKADFFNRETKKLDQKILRLAWQKRLRDALAHLSRE